MRHRIARLLAGIVGAEALVVMIGWVFGLDQLTRIVPVGINMKFITALLFLLSAVGLYLMSRVIRDGNELALVMLPGIALVIFLVTTTLLVGRLLGTPTGIENLFLNIAGPVDFSGAPSKEGWPSLFTLINFMLIGLVGVASLFPGFLRERFLTYLGYFIAAIGLVAVVGYTFGLPVLYYGISASMVPMALNTAVCFILLGFGLTQIYKPETEQ